MQDNRFGFYLSKKSGAVHRDSKGRVQWKLVRVGPRILAVAVTVDVHLSAPGRGLADRPHDFRPRLRRSLAGWVEDEEAFQEGMRWQGHCQAITVSEHLNANVTPNFFTTRINTMVNINPSNSMNITRQFDYPFF